ncbi:lipopolysaccharide assembly protein LapB [Candidatus Cyanaurora vandensis]|uniref:tetratricopeptide repeat protein n=1 Tax=Candidatus Cyanaurora vandensis TaxID=2714958 RepID=UPI00257F17C8|nr:hypothetical protein [Candidatus Cyanaurora vandensis]
MLGTPAWATPFIPERDDQVLEQLRTKPLDPVARELSQLRADLSRTPRDLPKALTLSRRYIEMGRLTADPRYNGYAQAVLAPWWEKPPAEVLLMRATLRQSSHDFKGALADLEQLIKADPRSAQARLTRAVVYQVQGEYALAKQDCASLIQLSTELVTVSCLAGVASLNRQAEQSYRLLARVLKASPQAGLGEKLWATTLLGEIAARQGQAKAAELHFKQAMALGPDAYLLGAYADFLLDQGRPQAVVDLLKDQTRVDGLLLRLVLAEQTLKAPVLATHRADLTARFAASRLRGDTVHQREEARFLLQVLKQPKQALPVAQANWQIQREPADTYLLLAAALAAGDKTAAQPALTWLQEVRTEDKQLAVLVKALGSGK